MPGAAQFLRVYLCMRECVHDIQLYIAHELASHIFL